MNSESSYIMIQPNSYHLNRREFIRLMRLGLIAAVVPDFTLSRADEAADTSWASLIPPEKNLKPEWIKALFERGEPELYRGAQLKKVQLPIGGICAGLLYLGGDGSVVGARFSDYPKAPKPVDQSFQLAVTSGGSTQQYKLNQESFPETTFRGEYPIARVDYAGAPTPVQVSLEAFSPFLPLNAEDSGLPATVFHFSLKNTSTAPVEATITGNLGNTIFNNNPVSVTGTRRNEIHRNPGFTILNCTVLDYTPAVRPEVIFEDWGKKTFEGWTVEGNAFGARPFVKADLEAKTGRTIGGPSIGLVNSYLPTGTCTAVGKLTSTPFKIDRPFISIWAGGGVGNKDTAINIVIGGKPVLSHLPGFMGEHTCHIFDVGIYVGKEATIEIVDASTADNFGWISVGRISFLDIVDDDLKLADFGAISLALVGPTAEVASASADGKSGDSASVPMESKIVGTLGRTVQLAPGESKEITFILSWHYPNLKIDKIGNVGRYYTGKFASSEAVASYVVTNLDSFAKTTRLWRDTWYDSTLPYWFLDRTFLNTSTLATGGCYRFANGRFYAYESGSGMGTGTCTHVWQYAHSMARLFPELERDTRERVDLGIAMTPATGVIGFRGEYDMHLAADGQAGTILRIYREHQMSADNSFLKRNWDKVKNAYNPLFALDPEGDGILEGAQMNTLDQPWFGKIAWMSSLYVAAAKAGEQMANEMGDTAFAERCGKIAAQGFVNIPAQLFNQEYFFNILDPKHPDSVNSGTGCYIDQVYGQSWAFQVGLPRILPEKETRTALQSLWKYNFSPDAGAFFSKEVLTIKRGRRFVWDGDAGMIMGSFPRPDWDMLKAGGNHGYAFYLIECWTGTEYQVASHMIWEGMVEEGMALVRAIHDRYGASKRDPYREIEFGDHYSRAMACYGVYLAACGYEYHGPQKRLSFAPRLSPEKFRAAFTGAEGWGTYSQNIDSGKFSALVDIKWGKLQLQSLAVDASKAGAIIQAKATLGGQSVEMKSTLQGDKQLLEFSQAITIEPDKALQIDLTA